MKYQRSDRRIRTRRYFVTGWVVLAIVALLVVGYSYLKRLKDPVLPAIKAIPESTVCLMEFKNTLSLWDRLHEKNNLWKELQCLSFVSDLNRGLQALDSLANTDDDVADILTQNPLYVAWVPDRAVYRYLFAITLNGPHREKLVDEFMRAHFSQGNTILSHQFLKNEIFEIYKAGKLICAYTVYQGVLIIGETSGVVESSLSTLLTKISMENDADFMRLNAAAGKNVEANIYIRNTYLDNLVSGYFTGMQYRKIKFLSLTGDMVGLDLTVKNDELLFAGYALSGKKDQLLNRVFSGQSPQPIELTDICPANTAVLTFWGVSNANAYVQNYTDFVKTHFHRHAFNELKAYYDTTYEINISEKFLNQIGNQFACVVTENPNIENPFNYYGVFKARHMGNFKQTLADMSVVPEEQFLARRDSFAIRKFLPVNFLKDFFGTMFDALDTAYYTTIRDYVVIGQSPLSLDLFVSGYLSGKTLQKNLNYIDFSDNVADEANFCLYTNIRKSFGLWLPLFNKKLQSDFLRNETAMKNFQALALQFTSDNSKFFLNAYIKHNSDYVEENPAVWEYHADTSISGKISVITDPRDSTKKIVFFDASNNIYLLGRNGQLIWKKQIREAPLSKVFVTSLKKDNKYYLIFNTKNLIYTFDLLGNKPDYSPLKLPYPASTAITLINYRGNDDYRIIIPCTNQKIYNYLLNGKPTPGWNNYRTEAILQQPVEYVRFQDKDMMIAVDKNGKVYFLSRNGTLLIKNKQAFIKGKNSRFYIHKDGKKQYLLTTDRKGKMIFISGNGKIDVVTLQPFSENHYFLVGDFDLDKWNDFIFFDMGKVIVYNHVKKKIFEARLKGNPAGKPQYAGLSRSKFQLVFPDSACSHLVLLNNKGMEELLNYPLGSPEIEITSLFGKNSRSILVSDSNTLLNYIIN
ncbi:MAG TPA: hypothetical protein PLB59_08510 [Bacteroidales bacterium]|nr:hypothetical protein [Bacteroidales bacterium]HPB25784.1 hypothetical protein [Bacteroidales bacterium]HPI29197.1 hypothetical protein [Bacteroidales bacterium]HQN16328.1 hypothetical protein [Bacteroidales bacterium]HQP15997.1 hypothetical protein [Bacteroidales bacterium]